MEIPPLPQNSRPQLRYSLSTIGQQLKTMATTTTTTATASAPISPRTRSIQHQQLLKQETYHAGKPTPSTSSSSSHSRGSSSKSNEKQPSTGSPLPEINNTTHDIHSTVLMTSSTSSTTTTTTCPSITRHMLDKPQVTHDAKRYMFKLCLDSKGNIAALCYLPTRFTTLIEFYHTEVPLAYRHLGIGDLLVQRAFEWVEQSNLLVIPTCSFVLRYLKTHYPDRNSGIWKYVVDDEHTGLERLSIGND